MKQPRPKTQGKVKSSAAEALARAGAHLINIVRQRTLNRATTDQGRTTAPALIAECPLPPSAALGSAVRAKGIERELRARLPWALRKHLKAETGRIAMQMPAHVQRLSGVDWYRLRYGHCLSVHEIALGQARRCQRST
jgi:hypothetical protein